MRWNYINISTQELVTGWKLYIYGEDVQDADIVAKCILPILLKYDMTAKIATKEVIKRNNLLQVPWGVAVIYLHCELFQKHIVTDILTEIDNAIKDYNKKGHYPGSHPISDKLSVRYDLNTPVNNLQGILYTHYFNDYRGEKGLFNINNNEVPNEFLQFSDISK